MCSVFCVSVITFADKTPAFYLYEINTLPLRTSFAVECEILQDAAKFPRPAKFHVQFSASDSNEAALVFRPFFAKERECRSVGVCLWDLVYIYFYMNYTMIPPS